ncbi:TRAP transporter small permease [Paracoccus aestuariivivens]|uniref:TRAP transporter small permease protein n=1 Tax=Paracoccus aestuariivivens TaxID=1820333 RepID=A0A6L6J9I1_9RHOB|nr:TRAP transporter small permease [Paracoccus aestuariivivens]MTH77327.1 TRAP transporter small permease subunit [Paracoccus aestuariivivens]
MRDFLLAAERFTGRLASVALWVAGIGLTLMTVFVFAQVFVRYVMNSSLHWAEPGSVLIMGWFIFLGAAVGIREGTHLSFDVLLMIMPEWLQGWMHTISDIAIAAFGVGMTYYGWSLAAKAADNVIPGLGLSRAFDFAPIIGGGVLLVIFAFERILRRLVGLRTLRFGDLVEE